MSFRPAELNESSDLIGRPDELAARLRRDGYVFFRGYLDPGAVQQVRHEELERLATLGWTAEGTDPRDVVPGPVIHREGSDEGWWPGYMAIQSQESFHRLAHDPAMVKLARDLLGGDEILVHPRKIGRVTYPGSAHPTPPHQDFPLIQGAPDTLTAWVPFGDVPVEMGGLRVLEGSSQEGLRPHGPAMGVGGIGVTADVDDPRWRTTDYRTGDVLVFFSFTVHFAPPNEGGRIRLSADYRYQSARDDVVAGSLGPHGHPVIPDWDELTVGWSSTEWVAAPPPQLVDIRIPTPDLTAGPSRFA